MDNRLFNFDSVEKICVENMRGGTGKVYLQKVQPLLENMKMYAKITIPYMSSIGVHTHIDDEELIYVLSGNGVVVIDDKRYELLTGMVNITKEGFNHSILNNNKDCDLVLLAVVNVTK